jgi:hypothetical protein
MPLAAAADLPEFRLIELPKGGDARETLSPADIDGDGDLDFYSGSFGAADWFENSGGGNWDRHVISDSTDTDVGAAVFDVDGDGAPDRMAGSFWYRNPGPGGGAFTTFRLGDLRYVHDLLAADMDGDGDSDVVSLLPREILWLRNPASPLDTAPWEKVVIASDEEYASHHGGLAVGDIDGDGDIDVSRMDRWFENPGDGSGNWTTRLGPEFGRAGPWGLTGRALILDVDGDGKNDLVQAECDLKNGRVAWFRNADGKGRSWETRLLKDSTEGQDFHSLAAADFDGDGHLEFFSMGGPNGSGIPKAYVWKRKDPQGADWTEHILLEGRFGHEAAAGDFDGDGDLDVLSKGWGDSLHYVLANQRISSGVTRLPALRPTRRTPEPPWRPRFRAREGWTDALGRFTPHAPPPLR